ncbi:MAG TPA: VOC family protein [Pirellulales bacterium]|nr:VOC family protein [Pirellulales bacterium]
MHVQPYLYLDGRTEEAIEFYKSALGATVERLLRFKDSPEPPQPGMVPPGCDDKVMHAQFKVGDTIIMASDGRCGGNPVIQGVSLTITTDTVDQAEKIFGALAAGGQVQMPMTKTFFSPRFGMVADRFGVGWMIIVAQ